jgi:hypothetical protein
LADIGRAGGTAARSSRAADGGEAADSDKAGNVGDGVPSEGAGARDGACCMGKGVMADTACFANTSWTEGDAWVAATV